jgi:hypothetical protein
MALSIFEPGVQWRDRYDTPVTILAVDPPDFGDHRYVRIKRPRCRTHVRYDQFVKRYHLDIIAFDRRVKHPDDPHGR